MTYLGEFPVSPELAAEMPTTPEGWALEYIDAYGQIDGDHHKTWVLDQVARILHGTPVTMVEARWTNHPPEVRYETGEPSAAYLARVEAHRAGEDGPTTYGYEVGIPP